MSHQPLPVVIIGAGPVGLAAAAHALSRSLTPLVLEAGAGAGAGIRTWGHVRMFSPWRYNVDAAASALLERHGWVRPDGDSYPTGHDLVERYLEPLAGVPELAAHIRFNARVAAVSRVDHDLMKDADRSTSPFVVRIAGPDGERDILALLDLATLAEQHSTTQVTWAIRRPSLGSLLGGARADQLEERGKLRARVRRLVDSGRLDLVTGFRCDVVVPGPGGLVVSAGSQRLPPVDEIIAATGFRPDWSILSEVRLGLDPAVQSPRALAPLIDPNVHSCGTVRPHGADELKHPDANLFAIGMKSYGRAPTFLMLTGYEQARSVVSAIAGDWDAARRVELVLPETGVCSLDGAADTGAAGCCGVEAVPVTVSIGRGTRAVAPTPQTGCCS